MSQILLIDDNATQLGVREAILRASGFAVAIATSAESALALLHSAPRQFGLVISDHFLTGATGVDIVRQVRTFLPQIPIVIISGMPGLEPEYEGLNVIVRQKPIPPPELIALVQTQLPAA
ncbi:MAG: response regulator [Candidatus Korobacteraceae bacterium]